MCPNQVCGSHDLIPLAVVTRPWPLWPWRQRKVGVYGRCARCGTEYVHTREATYVARSMAPQQREAIRAQVDRQAEQVLRDVIADARLPQHPGA